MGCARLRRRRGSQPPTGDVNRRVATGALMIVGTSVSIQLAAALATGLFDEVGPMGVSGLRFALGALVILPLVRPRVRGRDPATWRAVAAYGVTLAMLNLLFFASIDRLPLGVAVTLAFVAPLVMAIVSSHTRTDIAFAVLAAAGVVVLGGVDRPGSTAGVLLALAAGLAWVGVAYSARSVGTLTPNIEGLALAILIASLVTLPLALPHLGHLTTHTLLLSLLIAVGGLIVPFALELEGLRRLEPRVVAIIYSIDPAIAALVGLIALSQGLSAAQVAGMTAVIAASLGITARAAPQAAARPQPTTEAPAVGRVHSTDPS